MMTSADAKAFARVQHAGQTDKAGVPSIKHVERIASAAEMRVHHAHPLTWRPTWPEDCHDFVASVDGHLFARVYKTISVPTWAPQWAWSILLKQSPSALGFEKSGTAETKGQAVAAVRERWVLACEWSAEAGKPLIMRRDVRWPDQEG
ncbi:hypothetical protein [Methylobacterium nodulans]|uniref:Uncharacterized protein n=1 Tax=Methylobacterium nodulans (strain LMG 21967 / CNCM I-2342 / ORS 2060) TaxID=460265 RepID=B8IES3_METNO|nr:hypothetical protein [Methylobacterium nodulans]ACL61416.1 hypothetical protein Mnod_6650 [Methylobacterium nodulans ORS 2060]